MGAAFEPKTWEELAEDTYGMGTDGANDEEELDTEDENEDEDNEEE